MICQVHREQCLSQGFASNTQKLAVFNSNSGDTTEIWGRRKASAALRRRKGCPGRGWGGLGGRGLQRNSSIHQLPNLTKGEPELAGQLEKPANVTSGGADTVGVGGRVFPPLMQCPQLSDPFSWLRSYTSVKPAGPGTFSRH